MINFTDKELTCRCGCGKMPEQFAMTSLQALRTHFDNPMTINSAARCHKYNKSIGGAEHSRHVEGDAFDVSTLNWSGRKKWDFVFMAMRHGFSVGVYEEFVHIDLRKESVLFKK